jgi:Polyketide cyclase / dehydrase and lipid transport.
MPKSHIESSIVIHRPLEEVVAFVDDCENDPLWQTSVLESEKVSEGPVDVGTIYRTKEKFLGRVIYQTWEVVERNKDGTYWRARATLGPFQMETSMKFEAVDGGTRIERTLDLDVGHYFKVASPVVARVVKRELDMDFATLKDILESRKGG